MLIDRKVYSSIKVTVLLLSLIAISPLLNAQTENFERKYSLLVSQFGPAGVGVETVLNNWEAADSLNPKVYIARFNYWFTKAKSDQVVKKTESKYLGMKPILTLKDSTGVDIFYFEESFYDDALYGNAVKSIDKAIELDKNNLDYRFLKINAYIAYEKGSPDMALAYLLELVDKSSSPWKYNNEDVTSDFFADAMQEYCFSFYALGTPVSMEAFLFLSQKLADLYPKRPDFQNNIAAYYLIGQKDSKKALKQYSKVLKLFPNDYTALKNCAIITRRDGNTKAEAKYLKMLVEVAPDNEKAAIRARLSTL